MRTLSSIKSCLLSQAFMLEHKRVSRYKKEIISYCNIKMKFYIVRILKLLIGLTIAAMIYLSFKMHSGGSHHPFDDVTQGNGFRSIIRKLIHRDLGKFLFVTSGFRNKARRLGRSEVNLVAPSLSTEQDLSPVTTYRSFWKTVPYRNLSGNPPDFASWLQTANVMCDGVVTGYNNNFLYTTDMTINRKFCKCKMHGGEPVESVIMQEENEEYYKFDMGCFRTKCTSRPEYVFENDNHLNKWMMSLSTQDLDGNSAVEGLVVEDFTIAITRYEYVNMYHTVTDWYNAFLLKEFFNHTSFDTNILFIDAHPRGSLDKVWLHLFNSTKRLSSLPTQTKFKNLVWGILGYNSPMGIHITEKKIPLFEEFRSFFLDSFGIEEKNLPMHNCKTFNILFIWRHDYVAHPRNPVGSISRKIANEMELINYLKQKLPSSFRIKGSQIDVFEMKEQLKLVTWADILIGMHGAGLTHAIFLKKKSALIELVPSHMFEEQHFAAIANWRDLAYNGWTNKELFRELPDKSTIIPPSIVLTLVKKSIKDLCNISAYHALFSPLSNDTSDLVALS